MNTRRINRVLSGWRIPLLTGRPDRPPNEYVCLRELAPMPGNAGHG
jgi:hypothetical protein